MYNKTRSRKLKDKIARDVLVCTTCSKQVNTNRPPAWSVALFIFSTEFEKAVKKAVLASGSNRWPKEINPPPAHSLALVVSSKYNITFKTICSK